MINRALIYEEIRRMSEMMYRTINWVTDERMCVVYKLAPILTRERKLIKFTMYYIMKLFPQAKVVNAFKCSD